MAQINTNTKCKGCIDSRIGGRTDNQDSCGYSDTSFGLLIVVCDGMGGGPGGKLASSVAVDTIINAVKSSDVHARRKEILRDAVIMANHRLLQIVSEKPNLKGMGTTVAALLINDYSAIVAHIGDSRVYQFRRGTKKFRTFDHSMVFELVKKGSMSEEQARLSGQSNIITRALGHGTDVAPDIVELPYEKGDRFMLCTDGAWGCMPEKQLVKRAAGIKSIDGAMESLLIEIDDIGITNGNKHDNFSIALIETSTNSLLKETMSTRTKNIITGLGILLCISLLFNIIQASSKGGKDTERAAAEREMEETTKRYQDSISNLNKTINTLRNDTSRLNGKINGVREILKEASTTAETKGTQATEETNETKFNTVADNTDNATENQNKASMNWIIKRLQVLKNLPDGDRKNSFIKEAQDKLKALSKKIKSVSDDLNYINNKLGNKDAKKKSAKSDKLYDDLIKRANNIMNKL